MSPFAFVRLLRTWVLAISFLLLSVAGVGNDARRPLAAQPVNKDRNVRTELLPSFEPNLGQADPRVKFLSRGRGYTLFLTKDEAVVALRKAGGRGQRPEVRSQKSGVRSQGLDEEDRQLYVLRGQWRETMKGIRSGSPVAPHSSKPLLARPPRPQPASFLHLRLLSANPAVEVTGANELSGKNNYLIGNDPKKWRTNVPTYGRVRYANIYPGVDLVYYSKPGGQLEYDFVVAPGADPRAIRLGIDAGGPVSSRQKAEGSAQKAVGSKQKAVSSGQSSEVSCPPPPDPSSAEEGRKSAFPSLLRRGTRGGCSRGAESVATDRGPRTTDLRQFKIQKSKVKTDLRQSKIQNRKSKIPSSLRLAANGDLVVTTEGGEVQLHKPVVYQTESTVDSRQSTVKGRAAEESPANPKFKIQNPKLIPSRTPKSETQNRKLIDGRYVLKSDGEVTFDIAPYDKSLPLIIDPVVSYSTYLGGTDMDYANGIAVDVSGNAYVTGYTASTDFPFANPAQSSPGGGTCSDGVDAIACFDAFVAKMNSTGTALVYSTYLGGSNEDYGTSIALDASGHAYLTGYTNSTDFPVQSALQPGNAGGYDAFVAELSADGASLICSTYWGASLDDIGTGIAVDSSGNAYVSGYTASPDFSAASGALQPNYGGGSHNGFVVKFNSGGAQLGYSTFLGGSSDDYAYALAVDSAGDAYVTGATNSANFPTLNAFQPNYAGGLCATAPNAFPCYDAFVAKLNPAGSALIFSTYLGGTGSDYGYAIALDNSSNAYITGYTTSTNLPTTAGAFQRVFGGSYDEFVAKLNGAGSTLAYATYLGGNGTEIGNGIAVDSTGSAFVTGYNYGGHFPTANPLQAQNAGIYDAFVSVLSPTGSSLTFSTYLGGTYDEFGRGISLDPWGNAYVTGASFSLDFSTTSGSFQPSYVGGPYDAFVTKYNVSTLPRMNLSPSSYDFGDQAVGTTSSPETIILTNTGNAALTITSIIASGDFSQTNTCNSSVAANASCTINVTFRPTTAGTRTGAVTVTDSASPATQTVSLTGTGAAPAVSLSPASLTFPAQPVGASSSPQSLTLTNTGNASLTITSITASGDFSQANTCGASVAAGASCTISVTFRPTVAGTRKGTVAITDNANPATQTVSLTGSAVLAPIVSLTPASLTFSSQRVGTSSSAKSVTLKNTGKATLSISSIKTSGDFSQTNTCGAGVVAGASCTIRVTFRPTTAGTRTGAVSITDNASPATQTVSLTGTGTGPVVSLSPTSLTFSSQKVGTSSSAQSVTLKNSGNATLSNIIIRASGDFSQTNTCGSSVAAGASCTIRVTFKPTATGTRTGVVTITDNASPATQTVRLTGTGGAKTTVTYSPASLTFSTQTVGTSSPAQIVTLTNTGSATLSIASVSTSGDSSQTNNCGPNVAANTSCTLSVAFSPTAGGLRTGAVTIIDSAEGSPQIVTLTGTGEDFFFTAPPGSSTSAAISPGGTATYTLSIVGADGFNQNATLTCTGAPSEARCIVSPASVNLSSSSTLVTVTVATTAPSLGAPWHIPLPPVRPARPRPWLLWTMALAASASLAWTIQGRIHPGAGRSRAAWASLAVLSLVALTMAACGGGGGGSGALSPPSNSGTPPGTYTLTATGTCSSCSASLSHSVNLTLQVQ